MYFEQCFYRVSTKAIITDEQDRVLLIQEDDSRWELPGGGLEYDQSIEANLSRELEEEMGIKDPEIAPMPTYIWRQERTRADKVFYVLFLGYEVKAGLSNLRHSEEHVASCFFSKEELDKVNAHPNILNFIKLFKQRT